MKTPPAVVPAALLALLLISLGSCQYVAEILEPVNGTWSGSMTFVDVEAPITFQVSIERTGYTDIAGSLLSLFVGTETFPGTLPVPLEGSVIEGDLVLTADVYDVDGYRHQFTLTGTIGGGSSLGNARIDSYEGLTLAEQLVGTYSMTN